MDWVAFAFGMMGGMIGITIVFVILVIVERKRHG